MDANAGQVALAQKSAALNGWKDVHYRHGLVGSRMADAEESEFFLHPTSLGSSQFPYQDSDSGRPCAWKRISVPTLEIATTWHRLFGSDLRCHCLKIDIEGSEMIFLRSESNFLAQVDSVLIEWHSWATTRREVAGFLTDHGFNLKEEIEETDRHGVLFFQREKASALAN